jgi:cytochrome c peroxidase
VTNDRKDIGKFKAPTLRNVALTAPYMHDGSVATLDDVITHYSAGGRTISNGAHAGVGRDNPNKSATLKGFTLTAAQRQDLLAFLGSLTDKPLTLDIRFDNPWRRLMPSGSSSW